MNKKLPYSANKNFKTAINSFILLSLFIFLSSIGYSQCAKLLDGNSAASNKPIWTHCDGSAYTLYIQTNQSTGAYTINWGDGDTSAGASLNPPSTISHKYPASRKNYNITFTETDSACTVTGLLVIERPVNASITRPLGAGGGMNICAPGVLDFINTSTDVSVNTTFRWNFGDGSPIITKAYTDSGKTNSHTFQKPMVCRNATVRLEAENYCTSVPSFAAVGPISIYDKDKAVISTSGTFLCYPDTELTVINSSILNCRPQGNTTQRYEYWNFGNYWGQGADSVKGWIQFSNPPSLSQPLAFPGKGSYTITLYDSSLCGVDTANSTIVIGDSPVAVFSSSADTVCAGGRIRFFNNSTGGANISRWNFGDGIWRISGMWSRTHTFNTPGLYTIELAVFNTSGSGACTDTISKQIFVSELPTADFLINPTDGCDSVEITITENSRKAVQWNWDFGDGTNDTVSNPPNHKYKSIGNFDIKLMVTHSNGCSNNITKSIDVYGSPIVDFTPKKVCEGSIGFFRDNSISPGGDPFTSWTWDFGDGTFSSSQNNTHVYDTSGTYSLILTVTTAYCTTIDSFDLVVHPRPVAAFSVSDSLSCQPHSLNVSNNSTGANGYYWDFGNGDTSYTKSAFFPYVFSHNNANSTNFTLQLIAESQEGCFDTASKTIVTYPKIHADFGINDSIGCSPFYVNYSNISSGAQFYQWYFGDGDSSTVYNPKHFYQNSTSNKLNYTTTLIAKSSFGCYDTVTTSVQIQPKPSAIFTTTNSVSCSPLVTYFTNNSLNSTNYFWNFGDGGTSTQTSPAHTFTNSTGATVGYEITLIASTAFGCSDTTSDSVYVYHVPNSGFKTNAMPQCAPISVAFTNVSSGGIGQKWFFGDGDTASTPSNPTHTYKNQTLFIKNYTSKLLVTSSNGCTDTSQQVIVVYPEPIFTFQTNPDSGCSPLKVVFPSAVGAVDYKWYFGDGDSAKGSTPTHVYSNSTTNSLNFTTTLIAKSSFGCSDTNTGSIIVHPSPSAAISVSDSINCQPHSLNISNNSTGAYGYHWDFGNGDTSDTNASLFPYTYTHNNPTSTNFKLQLVVETQNGCFDTSFKIIKTYPQIHALYSMNDSVGCNPFRVTFTNNSTGQQFNA
ncbi:PKD domain-containing protein, partial [Salibacteraceae bacterium]|nr:PKD domain-containing protein [Salibacteraceae bacterium]